MRHWIVPLIVYGTYCMTAGSGIALAQPDEGLTVTKELIYTVPEGVEVRYEYLGAAGPHWACCCRRGDKEFVIVDGVAQKEYDLVLFPTFSADGKTFAYAVTSGEKGFVVLNGVEQKHYEFVSEPVLSSDGRRFAFVAEDDDKEFAVVDGVEQKRYSWVSDPTFSADGSRFAYEAHRQAEQFVVLDGVEQEEHQFILHLVFSPDGKRFAYCANTDCGDRVIVDGVEQKAYDDVRYPAFSQDGRRFAYAAESGGKWRIVLDGVEQKAYDQIGGGLLITPPETVLAFSPHGKRFGHRAEADGKSFIVLDGVELDSYEAVSNPRFSPDGKRFAYLAVSEGKAFVVLDGAEQEKMNGIWGPYTGSPGQCAFVWYGWLGEVRTRKSGLSGLDAELLWLQPGSKLHRFTARYKRAEPSAEPSTLPPRGDVGILSQTDLAEARAAGEAVIAAYLKGDVAGVWQGHSARALGHGLGETVNSDLLKSVYRRLKKEHGDDWPPPRPVLKAVPKTTILNLAGLLVLFLSKEAKAEMRAGTWPRWHGGVAVFEYTCLASPEILVMTKEDGEWMCFMGAMPSGPIDDGEHQASWLQLVQGFRDGELEHLSLLVWDSGK